MKKAAIVFGAIAISIYLITLLFRVQHWPGAGIILLYGTLFNLFISIPVIAIYIMSKSGPDRTRNSFGIISVFILVAGWTLKINHWPGASIMITLGTVLLILFIILYAIALARKS